MPGEHQSVSETIGWLGFPPQAYPNFYLNKERIGYRFRSYLGSIREFSESVEKSGEASASVDTLFVKAGFKGGLGGSKEIQWDLSDSLAQALVLRACLATVGDLATDARLAPVTDFVLARGPGGIVEPLEVADSSLWPKSAISPDSIAEIAAEQRRQAKIGTTADPEPSYWAAYADTDRGLAVSLLGDASVIRGDARTYRDVKMNYCIFGQKVRDWQSWTLISPIHIWVEPLNKRAWG